MIFKPMSISSLEDKLYISENITAVRHRVKMRNLSDIRSIKKKFEKYSNYNSVVSLLNQINRLAYLVNCSVGDFSKDVEAVKLKIEVCENDGFKFEQEDKEELLTWLNVLNVVLAPLGELLKDLIGQQKLKDGEKILTVAKNNSSASKTLEFLKQNGILNVDVLTVSELKHQISNGLTKNEYMFGYASVIYFGMLENYSDWHADSVEDNASKKSWLIFAPPSNNIHIIVWDLQLGPKKEVKFFEPWSGVHESSSIKIIEGSDIFEEVEYMSEENFKLKQPDLKKIVEKSDSVNAETSPLFVLVEDNDGEEYYALYDDIYHKPPILKVSKGKNIALSASRKNIREVNVGDYLIVKNGETDGKLLDEYSQKIWNKKNGKEPLDSVLRLRNMFKEKAVEAYEKNPDDFVNKISKGDKEYADHIRGVMFRLSIDSIIAPQSEQLIEDISFFVGLQNDSNSFIEAIGKLRQVRISAGREIAHDRAKELNDKDFISNIVSNNMWSYIRQGREKTTLLNTSFYEIKELMILDRQNLPIKSLGNIEPMRSLQ